LRNVGQQTVPFILQKLIQGLNPIQQEPVKEKQTQLMHRKKRETTSGAAAVGWDILLKKCGAAAWLGFRPYEELV